MNSSDLKTGCNESAKLDFSYPEYGYVETAFGDVSNRGTMVSIADLQLSKLTGPAYASLYRFDAQAAEFVNSQHSIKGLEQPVVWSDYLWLDIDRTVLDQALTDTLLLVKNLEQIDPEAICQLSLFFSGRKGFHVGIPSSLFGLKPSKDLPLQHRNLAVLLADGIEIDRSIYGVSRLLRLPYSLHPYTKLYKTEFSLEVLKGLSIGEVRLRTRDRLDLPQLHTLSVDRTPNPSQNLEAMLATAMKETQDRLSDDEDTEGNRDANWVNQKLADLREGNRHDSFASVIGWLATHKKSDESVYRFLLPWAEKSGFDPSELRRIVSDLLRKRRNGEPFDFSSTNSEKTKTDYKSVSLRELLNTTVPKIEWLIDKLVPKGGTVIVAGAAASGKSFLLMDATLALATGADFLGQFPTLKSTVLYIDEENGPQILSHRFNRLLNGRSMEEPPENIHFLVNQGILLDEKHELALNGVLDKLQPDVVIIDTLKRVTRAEENSATEVSAVFRLLNRLRIKHNLTVLIIDHHRKPGKNSSQSPDLMVRGSSDKAAYVDSLITVSSREDIMKVQHSKSRAAKPIKPISVELMDDGPDAIRLQFLGSADDIEAKSRASISLDVILRYVEDDWMSRKEIVAIAVDRYGLGPSPVDSALSFGTDQGILEKEERKAEGRGGLSHYYRRSGPAAENGNLTESLL